MNNINNFHEKNKQIKNCSIRVISGCFFKCKMCFYWKEKKGNFFDFDTYKQIILDLKRINPSFQVSLYGGEPLLFQHLDKFVRFATDNNIESTISTNGFLLTKKWINRLETSGLNHMYISIDGFTSKTHDTIRGMTGSHHKIMKSLELIKKIKPKFHVSPTFVIMKDNIEEVVDFVKWAQNIDTFKEISLQILEQPAHTKHEKQWYLNRKYESLWPNDALKIKQIFLELCNLKNKNKLKQKNNQLKNYESYYLYPEIFLKKKTNCNVIDNLLNIDVDGQVNLCTKMDPIGNNFKNNLYDLWSSKQAEFIRTNMKKCKTNCLQVLTTGYFNEK
jgi:sulfatase maturation enzyme AslB (radical SAM superfamily)